MGDVMFTFLDSAWPMVKGLLPWVLFILVLRAVVLMVKRARNAFKVVLVGGMLTGSCSAEFGPADTANLNSVRQDLSDFMRGAEPLYSVALDVRPTATLLGEAVAQTENSQYTAAGVWMILGVLLAFPLQAALSKRYL